MADKMDVDQTGEAGDAMEVDTAADKAFDDVLEKARDLETTSPDNAVQAYKDIINNKQGLDDPYAKGREQAIMALGAFFVKRQDATAIVNLSKELRPLFAELPKAKMSKIVRALIDLLAKVEGSQPLQIELCRDCIEWCKEDKRTFLRQRVETRLAALLLADSKYQEALELLNKLLLEVKKLDDKLQLVEIYLIECRGQYALQNIAKSKASLTAAKTSANAIHCPPLLQADIDLWSGIIHAREKDYLTSFSYFYEAFEAFNAADNAPKALQAMKLELLAKIMMGRPEETEQIMTSKTGLKYTGPQIECMAAVAKAHKERNLKKFEGVLHQYKDQLSEDPIISYHVKDLNETLLEQNILRILEPFSRVEISHVAELMDLPIQRTQTKLSEMILDQKLLGTLDQGIGVLIVFEAEQVPSTYKDALGTIKNTGDIMETLYSKAKQIG